MMGDFSYSDNSQDINSAKRSFSCIYSKCNPELVLLFTLL